MLTMTNKGGGGGAEMAQILLTLLMDSPLFIDTLHSIDTVVTHILHDLLIQGTNTLLYYNV